MSIVRLTVAACLIGLTVAVPAAGATAAAGSPVPVDIFYPDPCKSQLLQLHSGGATTAVASAGATTSLAASPVTDTLAYTVTDSSGSTDVYLSDYTGASRRRVVHLPSGGSITGWSADGTQLWLFDKIYSTVTGQVSVVTPTGNYHGGAPDPADPTAYFEGSDHVVNGTATAVLPSAGITAVSPDGSLVAGRTTASAPGKLLVAQRDGTIVNPNADDVGTSNSAPMVGFAFSPNDDYLYGIGSVSFGKGDGETWLVREDLTKQDQTPEPLTSHVPCLSTGGNVAVVPTDTTAPGPASRVSVTLNGAHPVLHWANPTGRDFSHVVIARYDGASATGTPTLLTAGYHATSFVDNVTVGNTYTYTLTAYDGAGNAAAPTPPISLRGLAAPSLHTPARSSDVGTTPAFPVSWAAAGAASSTAYTVQYLSDGYDYQAVYDDNWSTWVDHVVATRATFGAGGQPFSLALGDHVPFRVRAYDEYGNASVWTTGTRSAAFPGADASTYDGRLATLVPFDDAPVSYTDRHDNRYHNRLSYSSGWNAVRSSAAWRGGVRLTRRSGARATFALDHSQGPLYEGIPSKPTVFQLIGQRCARCGSIRIYVDGKLKGSYSTYATRTQDRRVLASIKLGRGSWHRKVVIVNVPTKHGAQLRVDGFAVP